MFIYRAYDQTKDVLETMGHFSVVQDKFFDFKEYYNLKTLKQLQNATLFVCNKSRETALAEMFNNELKFTVGSIKFWFNKNKKVLQLDEDIKHEFLQNSKPNTCCICDFPMESRAPGEWFEHVCRAEHLFLENLFEARDLYRMGILDFDNFFGKVKKVLDKTDEFCKSIEQENLENINSVKDNTEIEEIVKKIKASKNHKSDDYNKKRLLAIYINTALNFY